MRWKGKVGNPFNGVGRKGKAGNPPFNGMGRQGLLEAVGDTG